MKQFACPRCGGEDLVPGHMHSTGAVHFRPSDSKFMTLHTADISIEVHMCASCGCVTLLGDAEKLKHIRKGRDAELNYSKVASSRS